MLVLWKRNIKWRFHHRFTIVITILQPLLWLLLYSNVAAQLMKETGIEQYTAFMLPGLIVLVCFGTCSSAGIMNYLMKHDGSFYRILLAPVRRSSILLAAILEAVLCSFLEAGIMVLMSFVLGVRIPMDVTIIACSMLLLFLTAFFMAGICYIISMRLPNEVIYETMMNAIVLPVFFLSSALYPVNCIKGVLGILIQCNPFTYVINELRSLLLYQQIHVGDILFVVCLFLCLSVLSFKLAHRQLAKVDQ